MKNIFSTKGLIAEGIVFAMAGAILKIATTYKTIGDVLLAISMFALAFGIYKWVKEINAKKSIQ